MTESTGLFVKIWVKMLDDDWFISLNCTERGLWCQLLIYAKRMGDSGVMSWRSWGHLSHNFGITRSQAVRICNAFAQVGKIKIKQNKKEKGYVFEIIIPNYQYYQELKGGQKLSKNDTKKNSFGSTSDPQDIDIDKSRKEIDKNKESSTKVDPNHNLFVEYYCKEYEKKFGVKYNFSGGKDGKTVKTLLKTTYGYDMLCKMVLLFFADTSKFVDGHTLTKFLYQLQALSEELKNPKKTADYYINKVREEYKNE